MINKDASFSEIIGQRQQEETFRETDLMHRYLFETLTQGVILFDPKGKVLLINPAGERLLAMHMTSRSR